MENLSHENFTEEGIAKIVDSLSNIREDERKELIKYCLYDLKGISREVDKDVKLIPNKGKLESMLLMSKLITESKDYINMVLGSINESISNNDIYLNSFKDAIQRNLQINIVFLDIPNENSRLLELLRNEKNKSIHLYNGNNDQLKQKIANYFKNVNNEVYFAIFDGINAQVEFFPEQYIGYASINDSEYVGQTEHFFKEEILDGLKL